VVMIPINIAAATNFRGVIVPSLPP